MRDVDLVELTSRVSPTGNFDDRSTFVEMLEASIGVGLERTLVELEVLAWVLALAIGRVGEPYGGVQSYRPMAGRRGHRSRVARSSSCRCPARAPGPACRRRAACLRT